MGWMEVDVLLEAANTKREFVQTVDWKIAYRSIWRGLPCQDLFTNPLNFVFLWNRSVVSALRCIPLDSQKNSKKKFKNYKQRLLWRYQTFLAWNLSYNKRYWIVSWSSWSLHTEAASLVGFVSAVVGLIIGGGIFEVTVIAKSYTLFIPYYFCLLQFFWHKGL